MFPLLIVLSCLIFKVLRLSPLMCLYHCLCWLSMNTLLRFNLNKVLNHSIKPLIHQGNEVLCGVATLGLCFLLYQNHRFEYDL